MDSDQARQRAEQRFERAEDGRKAMIEYQAQAVATRERTARSTLRLAKEAHARTEQPAERPEKRTARNK